MIILRQLHGEGDKNYSLLLQLTTSLMPDRVAPEESADDRAGAVRVHFAVEEEKVEVARTRTARRFYRYSNPWNLRRDDSSLLATDGGNEGCMYNVACYFEVS